MRLSGIEIKNFRGFDLFSIDDFSQLNIIIGKNNVGKTAVLEALTLAVAGEEPDLIISLNKVREITDFSLDSFRNFFYNLQFDNHPSITSKWKFDNGDFFNKNTDIIALENSSYQVESADIFNNKSGLLTASPNDPRINQIDVITDSVNSEETKVSIHFSVNGRGLIDVKGRREVSEAVVFLSSTTTQEPILERVAYLKENRLAGPLLTLLSKIDSRIKDVQPIGNRLLLDIEGVSKLMPLGLLGDGVKKVMSIMASVIDTTSSTAILIDEIENGLHYSVHKELWKAVISIIGETNAQLFVTTHNVETLRYLKDVLQEYTDFQDKVRVFNVVKTKLKGFQAYKYTYEGLAGAIENEIEIRA